MEEKTAQIFETPQYGTGRFTPENAGASTENYAKSSKRWNKRSPRKKGIGARIQEKLIALEIPDPLWARILRRLIKYALPK